MALKLTKKLAILRQQQILFNLNCNAINVSLQKSTKYFTYINEITQPTKLKAPIIVPEKAVSLIKSGDIVFCSGAAATPTTLITEMVQHVKNCGHKNIMVIHMHNEYNYPENKQYLRSNPVFTKARKAIAGAGRGDYKPIFLQNIPQLFYRKIIIPDIALLTVSPRDMHGYCSTGTSVDCVRAALRHSKQIVAPINCQMSQTFGDSLIHHSSHFNAAIEIDEQKLGKFSAAETRIGKLIVAQNLALDGSALQMADAELKFLHYPKNLGIHSKMFGNGVVELVRRGCFTNYQKRCHQGQIGVGSLLIDDRKLYDFVNDNHSIKVLSVDYVNNERIISRYPKMVANNSALEIDLTGQLNSDSIGTSICSGYGRVVEGYDRRRKPIIVIALTTNKGVGKIASIFKPGAGAVTTTAQVHYVVTEYGVASLFGKNRRQRAHELINIAHPAHREELEKAVFERLKVMPSA